MRGVLAGVAGAVVAGALVAVQAGGAAAQLPRGSATERPSDADVYFDVCDDAEGSPIDLRRTDLALQDDEIAFFVETCQSWSPDELGDGRLEWNLTADAGQPDYAVRLVRQESGELGLEVVPDPGSGGGEPTFTGAATRDGDVVGGSVPTDALGGHRDFRFELRSEDAEGRSDLMPHHVEGGEPLLQFPNRCQAMTVGRYAVTTEPGRYGKATAAARGLGFTVDTEAPGAGVFSVRVPAKLPSAPDVVGEGLDVLGGDGLETGSLAESAREVLEVLPGVDQVDRPALVERFQTPTAPRYPDQWALPAVGAPEAWDTRTGSGLSVAVIDDGIDASRAVLQGRVAAGHDTRFDRPLEAGETSDRGGHGTAVAGVLAADGQAGVDVAGLDWSAELVPYRIFDAAGCGTDVEIAAALDRAAERGVAVANLSIGTTQDTDPLRRAAEHAEAEGMSVVAAAGNGKQTGNRAVYPAAYESVIGVGAVTRQNELADYSNTGTSVHVVAPGGDGSETAEGDVLVLGERGEVVPTSGTSFAAPLVAAAAAFSRAEAEDPTPQAVARLLSTTATDLGEPGLDDDFGHGLLDVATLLARTRQAMPTACPAGAVPSSGFNDLSGNVHRDRVACVVWHDIALGVTSTQYQPGVAVTRDQMATFLARTLEAAGHPLPEPTDQGFADLTGGPHDAAINQLARLGVVNGTTSTTYSPRQVVRRDQMASFLVRAYEEASIRLDQPSVRSFDDIIGNVHADNIDKAAEAGFAQGTGDRRYAPEHAVRRDQMATFIARVLDRFATEGRVTLPS